MENVVEESFKHKQILHANLKDGLISKAGVPLACIVPTNRAEQQRALHAQIRWNPAVASEMDVDRPVVEAALAALFKDRNVADIQWEG